ncbi:MAG: nitrite reductase (NADH) large subunit [Gammaproteobacteria bacterium]|jgi:nitrite reductase (NADH) large subunit
MRTDDPSIFAIGECAEVEGVVYGLVAPGLERASIAASVIAGVDAKFTGSIAQTNLKVLSTPVFSDGHVVDKPRNGRSISYTGSDNQSYRVLIVVRGRLLGAAGIGEWPERQRSEHVVRYRSRVWPWQRRHFARHGTLSLRLIENSINDWPAESIICNCLSVTRGQLSSAMRNGCTTVDTLAGSTRASTVCGGCQPLLAQMLGGQIAAAPTRSFKTLGVLSVLCLVGALAVASLKGIPYATSTATSTNWNWLWTTSFYKQVSGFSLLGLASAAALLSLRKRLPEVTWLTYPTWRLIHTAIGLALLVHTGYGSGENLNLWLMSCFLLIAASGALGGLTAAFEHQLPHKAAKSLRSVTTWALVIVLWPLPVLLGFHVLKTYYF